MFGKDDNDQPQPTTPNGVDASVGVSEKQIEEMGMAQPPDETIHKPTSPAIAGAPPLNDAASDNGGDSQSGVEQSLGNDPSQVLNSADLHGTALGETEPPKSDDSDDHADLMDIKQQALQSLGPMVHQLDQSPQEKFKTLMMLIQASDDDRYIKEAYEAANAIPDEKARAHALLDVVNEINYFTQKKKTGA